MVYPYDICQSTLLPIPSRQARAYLDGCPKNCRVIQLEQNLKGAIMNKLKGLIGVALAVMTVSAGLSGTAHAAGPTMTNITVVPPLMPASVGIAGDFAPGFGNGSIAGNGLVKAELVLPPAALFGRDVTLSEIASMSYWTKKAGDHVSAPSDWFLALYTKPYGGDVSTPSWYGDRIGTEPYFSNNIVETPGDWNQWVTGGASNKLRFFESTAGAPGSNFGAYTDPDWSTFVAASALSGQPRGPQQVLYFSVQTGSAWAAGFTGQVDGLRIELTDGSVANVNFEPVVPCTATCYVNNATGNDAYGGDTPATAKKTIQAAMTQVDSSGTVIVAAGAYAENVTIVKAVTLNGAQASVATSGRTFHDAAESTLTGQILVNAADVTIDGFSLTNPGQAFGIVVKTAGNNAQIKNNFIQNVGALTLPGGGGAQAVYLENGPDGVSIIGNDMQNISSDRSVKAVLIGDSTSTNPSENVTVEGNTMANITSAVRGAYGLIANNGTGTTNLVVRGNTIDTLTGNWGHAIGLEGPTQGALVEKNVISNVVDQNPTPFNDAVGVYFEANPPYKTASVTRNSFTSVFAGVAVAPALIGVDPGHASATCNWWGNANGPSGVGTGTGVAVGPSVTFLPWLLSSDLNSVCATVTTGTLSADASGNEGDTLNASGSFNGSGIVIAKDSGPGTVTDNGDGTWTWSYATTDDFVATPVVVKAVDVYGASATETFNASAANVNPSISSVANSGPIDEGSSATISVVASDVPADTLSYSFDCDNDVMYEVGSQAGNSTSCTFDDNGSYTVNVKVEDEDGGVSTGSTVVTVNNLAPTATFNVPAVTTLGGSFNLSLVSPFDPSSVDTTAGFQYAFDCGTGFGVYGLSNTATCTAPLTAGSLSVSGRIKDKDGGVTTYTGSVLVSPNVTKVAVRVGLAGLLPTGNKQNDDRIKKAIESIDDSLKGEYWSGPSTLTDKGKKVFDEEKKAVQELQKVTGVNVGWAITSLVQVDRALAEAAINSVNCGTDTKCQKELNKAQEALVKGNTEAAKPDPDKAIDNYKKAWEAAMKAMK
jgi:hypothetical protein